MHFLFSLLRIKGLHMFRALLAHPQESLHKQHLVNCVCVMAVSCTRNGVPLQSCQLAALGMEFHSNPVSWLHWEWSSTPILSVGCTGNGVPLQSCQLAALGMEFHSNPVSWLNRDWSSTPILVQPTAITRTQYGKCHLFSTF
jgi:hypothetical protein